MQRTANPPQNQRNQRGFAATPPESPHRISSAYSGFAKPISAEHSGITHIVSVSDGKDSTAVYLHMIEKGWPFRAVFADTGNELPETYEHVRLLHKRTGGPRVEWVRADFSAQIDRRRENLPEVWGKQGIAQERIERAVELLHATGNPFLDLCMLKGRFPSTRRKFCTEELKTLPIADQIMRPLTAPGLLPISHQGVRAEESKPRSLLQPWQEVLIGPRLARHRQLWQVVHRPILSWALADVLAIHRRHGMPLNPLYLRGFDRVGCAPCIHSVKSELRLLAQHYPAEVQRLGRWEALVADVCRRQRASFFAHDKTPGEHQRRPDIPMPGIREVVAWSQTSRGGRQFDMAALLSAEGEVCGAWGLCE